MPSAIAAVLTKALCSARNLILRNYHTTVTAARCVLRSRRTGATEFAATIRSIDLAYLNWIRSFSGIIECLFGGCPASCPFESYCWATRSRRLRLEGRFLRGLRPWKAYMCSTR